MAEDNRETEPDIIQTENFIKAKKSATQVEIMGALFSSIVFLIRNKLKYLKSYSNYR
jgi:hypothetical protein